MAADGHSRSHVVTFVLLRTLHMIRANRTLHWFGPSRIIATTGFHRLSVHLFMKLPRSGLTQTGTVIPPPRGGLVLILGATGRSLASAHSATPFRAGLSTS